MREKDEKQLINLIRIQSYSVGIILFIYILNSSKILYFICIIDAWFFGLTNIILFMKSKKIFWRNEVFSGKDAYPGLIVSIIAIIGSTYFLIIGL